eukprot:NODE_2578_length_1387_cov_135.166930_g2450_i0.p1 GENE.NODE_2578_length_1387_cov_135.166930_g2450_i0~~NODE_2578_length_1387_cov_135.166930_g2450_i0.p1  ORF type:complete len:386 (+),score=45.40 NODE_2578_length_1387_cov_135.166930_g2450_i0:57-1160(+)
MMSFGGYSYGSSYLPASSYPSYGTTYGASYGTTYPQFGSSFGYSGSVSRYASHTYALPAFQSTTYSSFPASTYPPAFPSAFSMPSIPTTMARPTLVPAGCDIFSSGLSGGYLPAFETAPSVPLNVYAPPAMYSNLQLTQFSGTTPCYSPMLSSYASSPMTASYSLGPLSTSTALVPHSQLINDTPLLGLSSGYYTSPTLNYSSISGNYFGFPSSFGFPSTTTSATSYPSNTFGTFPTTSAYDVSAFPSVATFSMSNMYSDRSTASPVFGAHPAFGASMYGGTSAPQSPPTASTPLPPSTPPPASRQNEDEVMNMPPTAHSGPLHFSAGEFAERQQASDSVRTEDLMNKMLQEQHNKTQESPEVAKEF